MATHLYYGPITLTNCLTREFSQEAVYDDSGTDIVCHKFTISVVGFVHGLTTVATGTLVKPSGPSALRSYAIPDTSHGAAINHKNIRAALMHPRQYFKLEVGASRDHTGDGEVLLDCFPSSNNADESKNSASHIDVRNGPHPLDCKITHVADNNVFRVEYRIEIYALECKTDGTNDNQTGVLSNRWSLVEDVDANFYTTRTISGRLKVATSRVNPLDFRAYVVPKLRKGFRRESMRFEVSADALTLDYTITDKEIAYSAPFPATSWSLRHTESVDTKMLAHAEIAVRLAGPRDVHKKILIATCAAIIEAKIYGTADPAQIVKPQHLIEQLSIVDIYGDNENAVEAYCRIRHTGGKKNADSNNPLLNLLVSTTLNIIGRPIEDADIPQSLKAKIQQEYPEYSGTYDNTKSIDPFENGGTRSGALYLADSFSSHLQSGCGVRTHNYNQGTPPTDPLSDGQEVDRAPTEEQTSVAVYQYTADAPQTETRSTSHLQAIYTHYRLESRYEEITHRVQLPVAKGNIASGSNNNPITALRTCRIVALGPSTLTRRVRISAERVGEYPQIPEAVSIIDSATTEPNNQTLIRHVVIHSQPEQQPNDAWIYRLEAQYDYALDRPLLSGETFRTGLIPWLTTQAQTTAVPATDAVVYLDPTTTGLNDPWSYV